MRPASSLIFIVALSLAACGNDKGLRDLTDLAAGPEEFEILPNKPLVTPKDMKTLPAPTPGSANLGDATPRMDAIAEVAWSQKDSRNFENFTERMAIQMRRYEMQNINAANHFYDLKQLL